MYSDEIGFFIGADNSGHEYIVPWAQRKDWWAWCEIPDGDERGWEAPEYAERLDGGTLVFPSYEIRSGS